jgi:UDP-N-acetylglucosamine acyltransferase
MDHAAMNLDNSVLTDPATTTLQTALPERAANIHPLALVALGAQIAPDAVVGPWCSVGPDVVIESGARLVSHVAVDGHTVIGADVVLYPFCTVGLPPQDLKYKGEPTETVIGARTQIREHCTIHRGTVTGAGITKVGADCLLMAVVHVAHDCSLGNGVIVANNVVMGGHVTISDNAVIGGQSAIHQFVRIGRGAMVGGASGVEADVVPFATVLGNRAYLSGLNLVGLKRRGVDRAGLHRLRAAFRTLFVNNPEETGEMFADRLTRVRDTAEDPLVLELLDFVTAPSRRGLIRHTAKRLEDEETA